MKKQILSDEEELDWISDQLNQLSVRRQNLTDRKNVLALLIDFKQSAGYSASDYTSEKSEADSVDEQLRDLAETKRELQERKDRILRRTANTLSTVPDKASSGNVISAQEPGQLQSPLSVIFIEPPPSYPAPQVILDVEKLPACPSPTQCPSCLQYITTETKSVVGNVAWLVCLISTMLCCVAGCCLIPFCTDRFKDVKHSCPRCRSHIHTLRKL